MIYSLVLLNREINNLRGEKKRIIKTVTMDLTVKEFRDFMIPIDKINEKIDDLKEAINILK